MTETLQEAQGRADKAERELEASRKHGNKVSAEHSDEGAGGLAELRKDSMMAHLLDSLDAGKDIGHYGRLVFAMVASRFLSEGEVLQWLTKDPDFDEHKAEAMLRQVEGRGYNPPRRQRILE